MTPHQRADTSGSAGHLALTIAICTRNRCDSLRKTLQGLSAVENPAGTEWEILVVNNNCSDHTDQVIRM